MKEARYEIDMNIVPKLAGTTLSSGNNAYFFIFLVLFFMVPVRELHCDIGHKTPWSESASELYRPSDRR
jgi:hypothetical protein